ncbi:MAG TPA: pyridoxamine 5'-phosphate oxidase family protein [Anaerolineales bacterium]|nr:pyridoxamine 5'-phosphate oxidase family protein [Anaerolineales bacterium]
MTRDYSLKKQKPTAHQRLPKYKVKDDWIREYLHHGQVAHIASLWDDQPFVTPSIYFYDEANARLIFHSNITGRLRANLERHPRVCLEVSELGRLLPSNVALEFSLQYRSVMVFGTARIIEDRAEKRRVLHQLIGKYFGELRPGADYRPATDQELKRTSVYEIKIESWSGKDHWREKADQSDEWPPLADRWLAAYK